MIGRMWGDTEPSVSPSPRTLAGSRNKPPRSEVRIKQATGGEVRITNAITTHKQRKMHISEEHVLAESEWPRGSQKLGYPSQPTRQPRS